jgi:hypothetical protein
MFRHHFTRRGAWIAEPVDNGGAFHPLGPENFIGSPAGTQRFSL